MSDEARYYGILNPMNGGFDASPFHPGFGVQDRWTGRFVTAYPSEIGRRLMAALRKTARKTGRPLNDCPINGRFVHAWRGDRWVLDTY